MWFVTRSMWPCGCGMWMNLTEGRSALSPRPRLSDGLVQSSPSQISNFSVCPVAHLATLLSGRWLQSSVVKCLVTEQETGWTDHTSDLKSEETSSSPNQPGRLCGPPKCLCIGCRGWCVDHSPASSYEVETEWRCTSAPHLCLRGTYGITFRARSEN